MNIRHFYVLVVVFLSLVKVEAIANCTPNPPLVNGETVNCVLVGGAETTNVNIGALDDITINIDAGASIVTNATTSISTANSSGLVIDNSGLINNVSASGSVILAAGVTSNVLVTNRVGGDIQFTPTAVNQANDYVINFNRGENITIINDGLIVQESVAGNSFSNPVAIRIFESTLFPAGTNPGSTVFNSSTGEIRVIGNLISRALDIRSSNMNITNDGVMTVVDTGGFSNGIFYTGINNRLASGSIITNNGTINVTTPNVFNFTGGIMGYSLNHASAGPISGNIFRNTGLINMDVTGGDAGGIYLLTQAGDSNIIDNSGTIIDINSSTFAILSADGDEQVTNTGTLIGDISLGVGIDTFTMVGGSLVGDLLMGAGGDTAVFDTVADTSTISLFDGGTEIDSLTLRSINHTGGDDIINWEAFNLENGSAFKLDSDLTMGAGAGGEVYIDGTSSLNFAGNSPGIFTIVGNLTHTGLLSSQDGDADDSLTITGNYTGNSGLLSIDTELNDGVVDHTDVLIINGDSAGTGIVSVSNAGGAGGDTGTGPTDGIQIIQVRGASNAQFTLVGSVAAGAYEYGLFQTDGQNWYLQSTGFARTVKAYVGTLSVAQSQGHFISDTLHDRMGELRLGLCSNKVDKDAGKDIRLFGKQCHQEEGSQYSSWIRVVGQHRDVDAKNTTLGYESDFGLLQGGFDIRLDREGSTLITGLMLGKGQSDVEFEQAVDADIDTLSIGTYATWFNQQGWYMDLVGMYLNHDYDVTSPVLNSTADYDGDGWQASIEGGYSMELNNGWIIEPQAQFTWSNLELDNFTDSLGAVVSDGDATSRQLRLALRAEKRIKLSNNKVLAPYTRINLLREFDGENNIKVPLEVGDDNVGTHYRVDAGLTMDAGNNSQVYVAVGYSHDLSGREFRGIDGRVGVRWQW